ncbi:MAG TPA: iron-sulfur cluster-binding domain-containing protein [Sphingobacteriaceae bacterium]
MNRGPHFWTVRNVTFETSDTITMEFDTGGEAFRFLAGQFINITVSVGDEQITRSYSLSSAPSYIYPSITVKRVPLGIMSNYLVDHWSEMEGVKVEGPFGNFIMPSGIPEDAELVFLAGGSGISPMYSLIREEGVSSRKISLINANRTIRDIIFHDGLSRLAASRNLRLVHALSADTSGETVPSDRVINGRLSRLVVKKLLKEMVPVHTGAYYFVCGPHSLNELYLSVLESLGIPEAQVITESFHHQPAKNPVSVAPDSTCEVLINWQEDASCYGVEADDKVVSISTLISVLPGDTILKAALQHGLPLRASCSAGTCGTCWARCISGTVIMQQNYALTEADVKDNLVLLCQSFPQDDHVTIDVMTD